MSDPAALKRIHHAATHGRIIPTDHALERMDERGAKPRDVEHAIKSATQAIDQGDDTFRLEGGVDRDGVPLVLAVREIWPGLLVITLF